MELFYESVGEGTPLILQAQHHISWTPYQFPYFSQYCRVITFDRRGTRRSESPPGPWSIADCAADVRALMDALKIDRAIVGGHEPQKTIEYSHGWHQQFKRGEFMILPDSYHGAAREQPVEWNAVHGFLRRKGL